MLITQLKQEKEIFNLIQDKDVFIFICKGCKEVFFPLDEVKNLIAKMQKAPLSVVVDYLCNTEFAKIYLEKSSDKINSADVVLVFSCGIGTQVVARECSTNVSLVKKIYTGCDTFYINGFKGVTVPAQGKYDCALCGQCYLNYTDGLCPITLCSKRLLNGPCGGEKNGKCELSNAAGIAIDCGWEKIYNRLKENNRLNKLTQAINLRKY